MNRLFLVVLAVPAFIAGCGSSSPPDVDFVVAVNSASTAFGRVVSEPAGIDCPGSCAAVFPAGATVQLDAQDSDEGRFEGWDNDCAEQRRCSIAPRGDTLVGIHFAAAPRPLAGTWIGGDSHVHTDHSSDGSLPRQIDQSNPGNVSVADQIAFAELVGLDFLALTDHRTWDQHYNPQWESSDLLLIPGEEANGRPHATVHGSIERVLQQGSNDLRALQQSIWDARAQGAVWVTAHPDRDNTESDGTPLPTASAVGIDAVEMWNIARDSDANIAFVENRWNHGFRFGVVAASDNHFRELRALAGPGMPRTRLLARSLSEREVIDAYRAGHSVVSTGNLGPQVRLLASVDGDDEPSFQAGDEITVPAGTPLRLHIEVQRGAGTVALVYRDPGRSAGPMAQFVPTSLLGNDTFTLDFVAEDTPSWVRVELRGPALPDSPIITVEGLLDNLAELDVPALLETVVSLPGQLRAGTSALFIAPETVTPQAEEPLPEAVDADDGAHHVIGSRLAWSGFPDVAEADGQTHIVAEAHVAGESRVVYRRIDSNGQAQPLINLAPQSASARFPRVAARGSDVWVVWQDERSGLLPRRPAIHVRHSADAGRSWAEEQVVRAVPGRAERPAIGLDIEGRPVVAWQEIRAGQPFDIWAQVLSIDAEPSNLSGVDKEFAAANAFDTRSARFPASVQPVVAVADDGRIAAGWQDNRADPDPLFSGRAGRPSGTSPDDWNIHLAIRGAGQAAWELRPSVGVSMEANRFPDLVWDATGVLHLLWEAQDLSDSGTVTRIAATRSADGALSWDAVSLLADSEEFSAQRPRLVAAADGGLRAVWFDGRAEDWRWGIASARHDGSGWQPAELLPAPGVNTWPALSATQMVFASTRQARRLQRDVTQQVFLRPLP